MRAAAAATGFAAALVVRGVAAHAAGAAAPEGAVARLKKKHECSVAGHYVPGCHELKVSASQP